MDSPYGVMHSIRRASIAEVRPVSLSQPDHAPVNAQVRQILVERGKGCDALIERKSLQVRLECLTPFLGLCRLELCTGAKICVGVVTGFLLWTRPDVRVRIVSLHNPPSNSHKSGTDIPRT